MEKTSFDYLWELLNPSTQYADRKDACRALWNARSLQWQRRVYYYLRELKKHGVKLEENPYFAINNCNPQPTNWNGLPGIKSMMALNKMVCAIYEGSYGTYTLNEARLFEMTDIRPLNF